MQGWHKHGFTERDASFDVCHIRGWQGAVDSGVAVTQQQYEVLSGGNRQCTIALGQINVRLHDKIALDASLIFYQRNFDGPTP